MSEPSSTGSHIGEHTPQIDKSGSIYELLAKDHPTEEEFKILLEHVSPGVLAKRYLHTGLPFVFKGQPHKYLSFREAIGKIFDVPPQNIAVMGSARFGFSTNPHKQDGGAKILDKNSDMDLVIVSKDYYDRALESFADYVFNELRDNNDLKSDAKDSDEKMQIKKETMLYIRRRSKALNFRYVNPADFVDNSPEKQLFYDMKREAGTQLFGTAPPGPINRVGAWIYKNWDAAEDMYEFSFKQLARTLGIRSIDDTAIEDDGI